MTIPHSVLKSPPTALGEPADVDAFSLAPSATCAPTILLVEDDPATRTGLCRVLASEGWNVICAATGEEALECLAARQPDLMITDLCLPDVSGWDLLFHESLQRPFLPIFVVTGLSREDAGGAENFAAMFFPKPVYLDALVRDIRRCLCTSRTADARPDRPVASERMRPEIRH